MTKDKIKTPGSREIKKSKVNYYDKLAEQDYQDKMYMFLLGKIRGPLMEAKVSKR